MPDILHKVRVNSASKDNVYKALTTCDGLAGWWTTDTTGDNRAERHGAERQGWPGVGLPPLQ